MDAWLETWGTITLLELLPEAMKMKLPLLLIVLMLFTGLAVGGCDNGRMSVPDGANTTVSTEIRSLAQAQLTIGVSDRGDIESFFVRHGIAFSYDRFTPKYHGIIRDVADAPSVDQAVVIYMYLNAEGKLERIEIRDSFTAL